MRQLESENYYFRTPYYSRKLCDGSYARADIRKKIAELYNDSLSTDGVDFIDAVSEFVSDSYDYQRISKRISSGESNEKRKRVFCLRLTQTVTVFFIYNFCFRSHQLCHTCVTNLFQFESKGSFQSST